MSKESINNSNNAITVAPSFEQSFEECRLILELFIKNQYLEALAKCEKWSKHSLYHSHGKSILLFLKAILTLEVPEIDAALESINDTLSMCQRYRKTSNLVDNVSKYLRKTNYNDYSEEQVQAELIYAEQQLVFSLLSFFSDQSIIALVKGALRIRLCNSLYKECMEILESRTEWKNSDMRTDFECGARMGLGTLNLVISHFPKRALLMLELIGFSGSRALGLELLTKVSKERKSLRYFPAQLILMGYECYAKKLLGFGCTDFVAVRDIAKCGLKEYNNSAIFLLFDARVLLLNGKFDEAIDGYTACIRSQNEIPQLHNICYWELIWCHAVKCEWSVAVKYSDLLTLHCKWALAMTTYLKATFLYMIMTEENKPELSGEITELYRLVPKLRTRRSGKTIPPEKYACFYAQKYFDQDCQLLLPALKLFYVWNIFGLINGEESYINPLVARINKNIIICQNDQTHGIENYLTLVFLKGVCMRQVKRHSDAIKCFSEVLRNEKHIITEKHILPEASLELGLTKLALNMTGEAKYWLKKAKNDYTGYLLETMIHFRVHYALQEIKLMQKSDV